MTFLALYEKLEELLKKLPASLHHPILRETEPLKTLFLQQRPPRLILLGERAVSRAAVVNSLFGEPATEPAGDGSQSGRWETFALGGRGTLKLLDARRPMSPQILSRALGEMLADLLLYVRGSERFNDDFAADLDHAVEVIGYADSQHAARPRLVAVQTGENASEDHRLELHGALFTKPPLAERTIAAMLLRERDNLIKQVAIELPGESQLEMARLSQNRELQRQVAGVLIKSMAAICGAVGAQPIPLADFPILTALQGAMVASLAHVSGRELNAKAGAEFLAAMGANVGVGLVFREGARAAAKFVPGWGNAISGGVAAAGTYAMGRAAVAYFIDGVPLAAAREVFQRRKKPTALLKSKKKE